MATEAARDCLARAGTTAGELGMVVVASGSAERRFPGPAASVAQRLGLDAAPALDIPMASAGSLVGLVLASRLAAEFGNVLVVGAEPAQLAALVVRMELVRLAARAEPGVSAGVQVE